MANKKSGRGYIGSIDKLPPACEDAILKANAALKKRDKTQTKIYAEFKKDLEKVKQDTGEVFSIPSHSSFSRHSMGICQMVQRAEQTRELVDALSTKLNAKTSDNLVISLVDTICSLTFEKLAGGEDLKPKELQAISNTLKTAQAVRKAAETNIINAKNHERGKSAELTDVKRKKILDRATMDILGRITSGENNAAD